MADEYKTLHPLKYYNYYLENDIRPDGRDFDKFRPIVLNVNSIATAEGSSICKIGQTTVVCGVKAEFCRPKPETPNEGFLIPNLELPPLCSPKFRPGPPSDQAQVLSQLIADTIQNSKCIDLKDLCIYPDKIAWCLFVDFICLDFDGALIDACLIGLMGALKTVTLPTVDYDPALDNKLINLEDRQPLKIYSTPVSTTFIIFDDKYILVDPTVEEENLCSGLVTIVVTGEDIACVHKPGGTALNESQLFECFQKSKTRALYLQDLIDTSVKSLK